MSKNEEVGFASALRADGPRRWDAPPEPGPEVTAVNDRYGWTHRRHEDIWCHVDASLKHHHMTWLELFFRYAPLTDATPTPAVGTAGGGQPNAPDLGSVETQKGTTE